MARSSNRIGVRSTHRGRRGVIVGVTVLVAAVLLFFYNASTVDPNSGNQAASGVTDPLAGTKEQEVGVSSPISRPFAVLTDQSGGDEPEGAQEASSDERASLQQTETYQDAVVLSQKVSTAYGTYDATTQSADEWVASVPSLSDDLRGRLADAATRAWPEMQDRRASAVATVDSQSVKPVRVSKDGRTLELSVSVTQKTSRDGKDGVTSSGYVVSLEQSDEGQWSVVDLA